MFLLHNPRFSALSSHQARLPVARHESLYTVPMIFLRHPIDRAGRSMRSSAGRPTTLRAR
jgi:hypothetical protein